MHYHNMQHTSLSLDDYLDLLNLAIRLGDEHWQAEIISTLKQMQEPPEMCSDKEEYSEQELWQCIDQINNRMHQLYAELKATQDESMQRKLLDQMWELKIARIEVFRKLKSIYQ
ncbi:MULTISPECIES: hypothetical protein [Paenibacillus]|uniref:hypothetical protein n=1 Tax=Paenibacillus TaxID=44249 RepID=UPI00119E4EF4|nr:hypothetical protein [Paenibacillus lactis]MCM3493079.1 hypothetical protein [Paenibacillus lactis]